MHHNKFRPSAGLPLFIRWVSPWQLPQPPLPHSLLDPPAPPSRQMSSQLHRDHMTYLLCTLSALPSSSSNFLSRLSSTLRGVNIHHPCYVCKRSGKSLERSSLKCQQGLDLGAGAAGTWAFLLICLLSLSSQHASFLQNP